MTALLQVQASVPARSTLHRLIGRSPLSSDARPWYWGALGELTVGRVLAKLGPGWHVLHAVPVGEGDTDIDHVVIGPGGVFTLNTKNHSGQNVWVAGRTFMVAGQKQPHIPKAEAEAQRAQRLLGRVLGGPVTVTPVLVVVEPKKITVRERPAQVVVVTASEVVRWLRRQPQVLSTDQVNQLSTAAARPGTWRNLPPEGCDLPALRLAFGGLDRTVRRARLVRSAWPIGLAGAGGVAALTVGPTLTATLVAHLLR